MVNVLGTGHEQRLLNDGENTSPQLRGNRRKSSGKRNEQPIDCLATRQPRSQQWRGLALDLTAFVFGQHAGKPFEFRPRIAVSHIMRPAEPAPRFDKVRLFPAVTAGMGNPEIEGAAIVAEFGALVPPGLRRLEFLWPAGACQNPKHRWRTMRSCCYRAIQVLSRQAAVSSGLFGVVCYLDLVLKKGAW